MVRDTILVFQLGGPFWNPPQLIRTDLKWRFRTHPLQIRARRGEGAEIPKRSGETRVSKTDKERRVSPSAPRSPLYFVPRALFNDTVVRKFLLSRQRKVLLDSFYSRERHSIFKKKIEKEEMKSIIFSDFAKHFESVYNRLSSSFLIWSKESNFRNDFYLACPNRLESELKLCWRSTKTLSKSNNPDSWATFKMKEKKRKNKNVQA